MHPDVRARIHAQLYRSKLIDDDTPAEEVEALIRQVDAGATALLAEGGLPDHVCRGEPPRRRCH